MKITNITKIGAVDFGIDGKDEYLKVEVEGEGSELFNRDAAYDWLYRGLTRLYWRKPSHPGGYFCHGVTVQSSPYDDATFTAIVHHKYDV